MLCLSWHFQLLPETVVPANITCQQNVEDHNSYVKASTHGTAEYVSDVKVKLMKRYQRSGSICSGSSISLPTNLFPTNLFYQIPNAGCSWHPP
jgi:hypothetical protein